MAKLSKSQVNILQRMRQGEQLIQHFPLSIRSSTTFRIGKNGEKIHAATVEALRVNAYIVYSHMTTGASTRHFYKLTELGRTCEL